MHSEGEGNGGEGGGSESDGTGKGVLSAGPCTVLSEDGDGDGTGGEARDGGGGGVVSGLESVGVPFGGLGFPGGAGVGSVRVPGSEVVGGLEGVPDFFGEGSEGSSGPVVNPTPGAAPVSSGIVGLASGGGAGTVPGVSGDPADVFGISLLDAERGVSEFDLGTVGIFVTVGLLLVTSEVPGPSKSRVELVSIGELRSSGFGHIDFFNFNIFNFNFFDFDFFNGLNVNSAVSESLEVSFGNTFNGELLFFGGGRVGCNSDFTHVQISLNYNYWLIALRSNDGKRLNSEVQIMAVMLCLTLLECSSAQMLHKRLSHPKKL